MSTAEAPAPARRGPGATVKLAVSLILLTHMTAIVACVLAAGNGPYALQQICAFFRPYLRFMWLDNAYRFYAPDPGGTDVLWFYLKYEDGSNRWYQLPNRDDFTLRMPFQRYISVALHAALKNDFRRVPLKDDPQAVSMALRENRPKIAEYLNPTGLIYFRSYARHVARQHREHPETHARLAALDVYKANYRSRLPYDIRQNLDMYDLRLVTASSVASFDPEGNLIDEDGRPLKEQRSFVDWDIGTIGDFFVTLMQRDLIPLVEANAQLPPDRRKTIRQVILDYGIPYPFVLPILKLSPEEQEKFFEKPYDRDTLRERYGRAVVRDDRPWMMPESEKLKEQQAKDKAVPAKTGGGDAARSVQ